jgi:hypothetical protein
MDTSIYNLLVEPSNRNYYDLLEYALTDCKYALFVIRDPMYLNQNGEKVLKSLSKYIHKEMQSDEWPGTKLLTRQARVLLYFYNQETSEILKNQVTHIYQWLHPDLPEDLCLLRADETPWLVTISHEDDGYLNLSEQEANHLINVLPKYRKILEKQD